MLRAAIDRLPLDRLPFDRLPRGKAWAVAGIVLLLVLLAYPLGMLAVHDINDDPDFTPGPAFQVEGGAQAVSMAAALIHREIDETTWAANKPWFHPAAALDNMPNFQVGMMYAISRFAIEMTDSLGRTRGSSQADGDLDRASGLLKYDGTIWVWEPSTSLLPTASAEKQYEAGLKALMNYNTRLGQGAAVYDRRADNLISLLDRVSSDLGSSSAALDARATSSNAGWFDTEADDIFYAVKGRLYAYHMLLSAIGKDFEGVIAEKNATAVWQQMLDSMRTAAEMDPLLIANGSNDGLLVPSHLAVQGFYLLRARTQLQEVASILLK